MFTVTRRIPAETVSTRPIVVPLPLASKSCPLNGSKRAIAVGLAATGEDGKELQHDSWPKIGIGRGQTRSFR